MAIYKFIDNKDVKSFCDGHMLFRKSKYFRELEEDDKIGRTDKFDGTFMSKRYETINGGKIKFNIVPDRNNYYVLCATHQLCLKNLQKLRKMGETIIVIEDEVSFINKIRKTATDNYQNIIDGDVFYYNDNLEDEMQVMNFITQGLEYYSFLKQGDFAWQKEYGFVLTTEIENNRNETIWLDIGNIEDIAKAYTFDEIKEKLI